MRMRVAAFALVAAGLAISGSAEAAAINFAPAQNFTGPADVSTAGTLVRAYDFGAGNLTVNGVPFTDFNSQTQDTRSNLGNQYNGYGSAAQAGDYGTLLSNGDWNDGGSSGITFNGLTAGALYQVQVWVNDARVCCGDRTNVYSGDAAGVDGVAQFDRANATGQFVTGTFLASGTSQVLNIDLNAGSTNNNQINGLSLRQVPEPATLGVFALAGLGLMVRRRA